MTTNCDRRALDLLGGCLPRDGRFVLVVNTASSESELSGALGLALPALVFVFSWAFTLALSGTSSPLSPISDSGALSGVETAAALAKGTSSVMTSLLNGEGIAFAATCFVGAARGTSSSEEPDLAGLRLCGRDLGAGFFNEDEGGG